MKISEAKLGHGERCNWPNIKAEMIGLLKDLKIHIVNTRNDNNIKFWKKNSSTAFEGFIYSEGEKYKFSISFKDVKGRYPENVNWSRYAGNSFDEFVQDINDAFFYYNNGDNYAKDVEGFFKILDWYKPLARDDIYRSDILPADRFKMIKDALQDANAVDVPSEIPSDDVLFSVATYLSNNRDYGLDESVKTLHERIAKFPTKESWYAVDFMSLIFEVVSKNENVFDANTIDAEIGHNPGVWFEIKGASGDTYRFTVDCANDESYHMICQVDQNTKSLAEWTGIGLDEFTEDFNEAISLDWT